ncbi:aspartic peptidase domain-containing protein [Phascolomyces articulosus]|uniref:Mucorpepsin n=1 Tax=Phascolomyces articulosus TaxID=60185 RepID=A0AAD5KBG3_9FUNG|nr:aspartic peptidase domain-containing protein [Phascolomyces articulosus]
MKLSTSIAAILAATVCTQALPTNNQPKGQIVIPLHTNDRFRPDPSISLRNAQSRYAKFVVNEGGRPSMNNKITVDSNGYDPTLVSNNGKVPLKVIQNDVQYVGKVSIGTPPQVLELNFDTGSADLWFISTLCKDCDEYNTQFNHEESQTFRWGEERKEWAIQYGDGSTASGLVGYDTVNLGGLSIHDQGIELATHETKMDSVVHGILGLGFPQLCTVKGLKTPLQNLIAQNLIEKPIFSFSLGQYLHGGGGELIFGGINKDRYVGELTSFPVENLEGYWGVTLVSATIGDELISFDEITSKIPKLTSADLKDVTSKIPKILNRRDGGDLLNTALSGSELPTNSLSADVLPTVPTLRAVLDTGTTLVIFPQVLADIIAKKYDATPTKDGTYIITCDLSKIPPLTLNFGTASYVIPSESLIYYNDGQGQCTAGFANAQFPFVILGDVFLKNVYTVFDYGTPPTVSLAQAVLPPQYNDNNKEHFDN